MRTYSRHLTLLTPGLAEAGADCTEDSSKPGEVECCFVDPSGKPEPKCETYKTEFALDSLVDSGAEEYQHLQDGTGAWVQRRGPK